MNSTDAPAPEVYYDRSTGLMVFGILTALLGVLAIGMSFLIVVSQTLVASLHQPGFEATPMGAVLPGMVIYVVIGIGLIWAGIGSCLARRWARAVLTIFSWSWLIFGILIFVAAAIFLPMFMSHVMALQAQQSGRPVPAGGAALGVIVVIALAFYGLFLVLMPAIWTYFYNSRHVKATCDYRDPVPRWTDRCPLPVLAVSMWTVLCAPLMMVQAAGGFVVMPLFGLLLGGLPAIAFYILLAAIWGIAGVLMYRLNILGWWLLLATMLILMVSSAITYSLHDPIEIYQVIHYPAAQVEQLQKLGILNHRSWMVALSVIAIFPFAGYLLFIKRYFRAIRVY